MADEQWNIDTDGLRVGGKLWNGERGWFVIVRLAPGKVWVRPDKLSVSTALTGAAKEVK